MGPYGSQNFKTLLLLQITFESFQTFSAFSSQWSSQKYCFRFLKFGVFDFSGILFLLWHSNVFHNTPHFDIFYRSVSVCENKYPRIIRYVEVNTVSSCSSFASAALWMYIVLSCVTTSKNTTNAERGILSVSLWGLVKEGGGGSG